MKNNTSLVSIFLVIVTCFGCLPEPIETEVPEAEVKLVISSQVLPFNFMLVTVTRSFSALEGSFGADLDKNDIDKFLVRDALVTISYQGIVDTLLGDSSTPGVYISRLKLDVENQEFDLYVEDNSTGLIVTSHAKMLSRVDINSFNIKEVQGSIDTSINVAISFTDPVGPNWYVVNLINPNDLGNGLGSAFSFAGAGNNYSILLSDEAFPDGEIAANSEFFFTPYSAGDTVIAMLSNISQTYFEYLNARQRGGGILSSITGEPINYPSNIVGGYGFFNTHNPSLSYTIIEK